MLGRNDSNQCIPGNADKDYMERCKRDIFSDMKLGLDALKACDERLQQLHPDVIYKIRQII
jgi:hypothetical protein